MDLLHTVSNYQMQYLDLFKDCYALEAEEALSNTQRVAEALYKSHKAAKALAIPHRVADSRIIPTEIQKTLYMSKRATVTIQGSVFQHEKLHPRIYFSL
jgi:hypothetical protein